MLLLKRFLPNTKRRTIMRKIALGLVAAATISAAAFTAAPAMAQIGFYAGPGGVGIGVGVPGPYYDCGYYGCGRRYYDDYSTRVYVGPRWQHHRHWHDWD
jgi:hypothetical protein